MNSGNAKVKNLPKGLLNAPNFSLPDTVTATREEMTAAIHHDEMLQRVGLRILLKHYGIVERSDNLHWRKLCVTLLEETGVIPYFQYKNRRAVSAGRKQKWTSAEKIKLWMAVQITLACDRTLNVERACSVIREESLWRMGVDSVIARYKEAKRFVQNNKDAELVRHARNLVEKGALKFKEEFVAK